MIEPPDNSRNPDRLSFFIAINEQRGNLVEGGNSRVVFAGLAELTRTHFESESAVILLSGDEEFSSPVMGAAGITGEAAAPLGRLAQALAGPDQLSESPWEHSLGIGISSREQKIAGSVLVGRRDHPYSDDDRDLLSLLADQLESIFRETKNLRKLEQRNRELNCIFQIDRIRDEVDDFDEMLQQILAEICRVISSSAGFLLLYRPGEKEEFEVKATTTRFLSSDPGYLEAIEGISREAMLKMEPVNRDHLGSPVDSIVALPLILNENVIGVLGAVNSDQGRGFDKSDVRVLKAVTSQLDTAVFERLERKKMRQVLSRSVDPKVLDALLDRADDSLFAGENVVLSILFTDIRGSTDWAERIHPEEFVSSLNTFLSRMTEVIFKHGGTLDKFVGDEIIALFGSPVPMEDHALHASRAAVKMQMAHRELQEKFREEDRELPPIGVGISSGEAIAGEFGPPNRTDFTAMGRVTNRGSRLCSAARGHQIIICETTRELLAEREPTAELDRVKLKGIREPVPVFELIGEHRDFAAAPGQPL